MGETGAQLAGFFWRHDLVRPVRVGVLKKQGIIDTKK